MQSNLITYYINSKYRWWGTAEDFTYILYDWLPANITHCAITSITIPKTYYLINDTNNICVLVQTDINTLIETQYNIIFPYGNYNEQQFLTKLNDLINNVQSDVIYSVLWLTEDYDTGKMKIEYDNTIYLFDVNIYISMSSDINELMGLNKGTNNFIDGLLIWTQIMNLNNENNLYLQCNVVQNEINNWYWANVLCVVYAHDMQYLWFFTQNFDINTNKKKCVTNTQELKFTLVNEVGKRINLNGVDMSFTIHFFTDYSYLYSKFSDFINLITLQK